MADFSQTISNSINCFGGGPSSLWNASYAVWNAFKWGEGTADIVHQIEHLLSETITPSDAITEHSATKALSESLSPTSDMTSETLQDSTGYYYIFPSNAQNAEDRDDATWTTGTPGAQVWTSASVASVSWS